MADLSLPRAARLKTDLMSFVRNLAQCIALTVWAIFTEPHHIPWLTPKPIRYEAANIVIVTGTKPADRHWFRSHGRNIIIASDSEHAGNSRPHCPVARVIGSSHHVRDPRITRDVD